MGRSKKAIKEAADLFYRVINGDADACIKIWEIIQDEETETDGGANDENKQRNNCRKTTKGG